MSAGLLGYSLLFELLLGYFALHLLFPNTPRRWLALGIGILLLLYWAALTPHQTADVLGGHYDIFWRGALEDFGFR
ncbi:MAG: hypothetical protein Q8P05_05685 [Candidatus Diapherotrites archaeon]|nr:hypothetical protein [Candidatus Diapherotrites archaeon]MDZ4256823.1 hypothetical protein [archaeon]